MGSLIKSIRQKSLQKKYGHHRVAERIDISWRSINFNRIAVINLLLSGTPDASYLEIGCANNSTFDSIFAENKTGVDPLKGGTHRMTSDEFFQTEAKGRSWDVIFLDGLHTYEQTRRDCEHAIAHLSEGGWIALHDMLPRDWIEEHVPIITDGIWTGDVWKLGLELSQSQDIDFRIIRIDNGVGVMRLRRPGARIRNLSDTIAKERFAYFLKHYADFPIVDYSEGRRWIVERLAR